MEHVIPCLSVPSVLIRCLYILEYKPHSFLCKSPGLLRCGTADISLDCVCESVHACGSRKRRRKRVCYLGIEHVIPWYQREAVQGVFMLLLTVSNDRSNRHLASRTGSSWYRYKRRYPAPDLKYALHLIYAAPRVRKPGSDRLRAID